MTATDEDALRCDFAQVYQIHDYRRLPLRTAAVFAQGLPEDSRIMRAISGAKTELNTALLARIADEVAMIRWLLSEDGHEGRNRPRLISQILLGGESEEDRPRGFASAAEFRAAWSSITEGGANHA